MIPRRLIFNRCLTNLTNLIRTSYCLLDSFLPPQRKTFDPIFLDMMYVEFMKNFYLADSNSLMAP